MSERAMCIYRSGLLVLSLLLPAPLLVAGAAVDTWVRVLPPGGAYPQEDQIAVEVWIENVVALYGADVRLGFDADRLAVVDANPSLPGVQVFPGNDLLSPDLVIRNEADNDAGTVWYAVSQISPSPPVTGTGVLYSFTFQVLRQAGQAPVEITYQRLSTVDGAEIPAGSAGAIYLVNGPYRQFLPLVLSGH